MNHVIRAIAEHATGGNMMAITTAFFLLFFLGCWAWAYLPANRQRWEEAGRMPFDDGDPS